MTKVLITNVYGDDNKGGAAITWATIEAVRRAFPGSTQSLLTISTSGELNQSHRHTRACYPDVPMHPPLVTEGRSRLEDASKFARAGLIHRGFGCVPQVDDADLVTGLVRTHLGEGHAPALEDRVVLTREQLGDHLAGGDLELADAPDELSGKHGREGSLTAPRRGRRCAG